jgi:hypothetical protein
VSADTALTVEPASGYPADAGLVPDAVYTLGPSGLTFAKPIELTLKYDPARVPAGIEPTSLRLATVVGSAWEAVAGSTVDTTAKTVTGAVSHFSSFGIVGGAAPAKKPAIVWVRGGVPQAETRYAVNPDGSDARVVPLYMNGTTQTTIVVSYSLDGSKFLGYTVGTGAPGVFRTKDGLKLNAVPYAGNGAWSPDGTKIATVVQTTDNAPQRTNIVIMSADGASSAPITNAFAVSLGGGDWDVENFDSPVWTPDGQAVIVRYRRTNGPTLSGHLKRIPLVGSSSVFADILSAGPAAYAPGGVLWVSTQTGTGPILYRRVEGGSLTGALPTAPVYSPDGAKIAWAEAGKIWTSAPSGEGIQAVYTDANAGAVLCWSSDWPR